MEQSKPGGVWPRCHAGADHVGALRQLIKNDDIQTDEVHRFRKQRF